MGLKISGLESDCDDSECGVKVSEADNEEMLETNWSELGSFDDSTRDLR